MAKSTGTPATKGQKNLFSFFSKKATPSSTKKASSSSPPSSSSGSSSNAKQQSSTRITSNTKESSSSSSSVSKGPLKSISPAQQKLLSKLTIGTKLAVFWPDDNEFYPCIVHAHRAKPRASHPGYVYEIHYDDGEVETIDLSTERFKIIGGKVKRQPTREEDTKSNAAKESSDDNAKKRRRIMEESEEEMEFDEVVESSDEGEGDDSGSEYKGGDDASVDDESLEAKNLSEDNWLASDDEEDEEAPKKKNIKKSAAVKNVTITRVNGAGGSTSVTPTPAKPSNNESGKNSSGDNMDLSNFAASGNKAARGAAPSAVDAVASRASSSPVPFKPASKNSAAAAAKAPSSTKAPTAPAAVIPKPIPGQVNAAGTHMHNHLQFFTTNRRDAHRRPPTHPDYSPRTLYVDYNELAKKQDNGKLSAGQKQWWDIKSQYADTVLLFKTGKFYEMYHDDADVGAKVLNFVYMKGTSAHGGFPEAAYATMVHKLVEAGYRVARVEQTETPAALAERKKGMRKGQAKPQVVCREVCGIVSKGTRTFCYLEDARYLERGDKNGTTGPLVAIKEVLVKEEEEDAMKEDGNEEGGTKAVYEYGVTVVDAITGTVTLGQFADDVLRSRLLTLLTSFGPSEVLYEGGPSGASKSLLPFLKSACSPTTVIDCIKATEPFPKSTAVNSAHRQLLDRTQSDVHPWNVKEALREVHRRGYYPRSSRKKSEADIDPSAGEGIGRWPEILKTCVEGGASLALSSFGAALYFLQRSLVDAEILSMGIVKAYAPPNTSMETTASGSNSPGGDASRDPSSQLQNMYNEEARREEGTNLVEEQEKQQPSSIDFRSSAMDESDAYAAEASIDHMALDGTTLSNLEILHNITSGSHQGSLLSKIDATQSPHGSRLLRAWLLRPLFRKVDIDRRADVVEELAGGSAAMAMEEARALLKKTGDIERLLSRVHSMGGGGHQEDRGGNGGGATQGRYHPNDRAILYETEKHTKRKVGDFSKLLHGLKAAAEIPELFENANIHSPMLAKIVRTTDAGGCFPADMKEKLDWFFDNFDLVQAAQGKFEPSRGMDEEYDEACDAIEDVKRQFAEYKEEMCSNSEVTPRHTARSSWKYINTKEDSKDKYLIELPVSVNVPDDFFVKAKRGKGPKQVNKYRTPIVEQLVEELERAIDVKNERKAEGMKLVFKRFDDMRSVWMAATHATAMLDALGSLAQLAVQPGFSRPQIMDCPPSAKPGIEIIQGRHPCVDFTHSGGDFIPNDLILGGKFDSMEDEFQDNEAQRNDSSVLLLSGPNMGGKSTLLRQTCLISILAQMGSYVPAEKCAMTPVDRIFTRLGASDRILCGQSTFFVELAETAAAVRGATRRSLVIMDELGRGTSTFDGTAIASATVKHLVEVNRCLTLFATHYHSLLEDWKNESSIKLGHMECIVEDDNDESDSERKNNITFLYTLGDGPCPKSFGVNVARLAGLPDDVLQRAKRVSSLFEAEMNGEAASNQHKIIPSTAETTVDEISKLLSGNVSSVNALKQLWESLQ